VRAVRIAQGQRYLPTGGLLMRIKVIINAKDADEQERIINAIRLLGVSYSIELNGAIIGGGSTTSVVLSTKMPNWSGGGGGGT
jgi:hypothetical protein